MNMHLSRLDKRRDFCAFICNTVQIDICAVTETKFKKGQGEEKMKEVIDEEIYMWLNKERAKQRSRGGEGGVGFLVRKSAGQVQIEKVSNLFDILWIRVQVEEEILFLAAVYMSPVNTTRDTDAAEFLLELSDDILEFRKRGKVIVMGDLNSRVGNRPSGFFLNDRHYEFARESDDVDLSKGVRRQGRRLLELMDANRMVILNGIDGGGEFTCIHRNKGASMIDYIIMSYDLLLYNPELEREEEVGRDYKHKIVQKQTVNLLEPKEEKPNKIIYNRQSMKVWTEYSSNISDHRLVTCELVIPEQKRKAIETKIERPSEEILGRINIPRWKRGKGGTDPIWEEFQREVKAGIREWKHAAELYEVEGKEENSEPLSEELINVINKAAITSLGIVKTSKKKTKRRQVIWNQELYDLNTREKEAYDRWLMAPTGDREQFRQEYRIVARIKRRKLREYNRTTEEKIVKDIEELKVKDPKAYWNKLKKLSGKEIKKQLPARMRNTRGEMVEGTETMAVWEQAFQQLGKQEDNIQYDKDFARKIEQEVRQINEIEEYERRYGIEQKDTLTKRMNRAIEIEEVGAAIKTLRNGKAVGIDGVTNEILKFGGKDLEEAIWKLFNNIWQEEEIPESWSRGLIFPIFKGGPPEAQYNPLKYRGITLLSVVGKLYTAILNERLTDWVETKGILAEEQAGSGSSDLQQTNYSYSTS